jgi:hypothetical protein
LTPPTDERVWFIWLTSYAEPVDHAVTDEEMAASRGNYRAMCNALFFPAAMESPPKPSLPSLPQSAAAHLTNPTPNNPISPTVNTPCQPDYGL